MPSATGTPTAIDDRELEQLAAEPSRPLFPLLGAAEAMVPLVVALAFLLPLYALAHGALTEQSALQGLEGLRVLSAFGNGAAAPPVGYERLEPLRFQPPLMSWITAVSMKLFGTGSAAGLVAPAYLCTAGLLLAAYFFGRRLGGESLGLASAVLLAFNPLILEGAREPIPQSAAGLFALLTLTGIIAHWQRSSSLVSYQLLLAGISLGLCLLAGGPVALAIVAAITCHIIVWKIEAHWRKSAGIVWDRSRFSRRTALRSELALVATAFALAGWHVLLSCSRYGSEFWSRWLLPAGGDPLPAAAAALHSRPSLFGLELIRLALPLVGLAIVGLAVIVRDVWQGHEDPARRHRMILFPWILIAAAVCLWIGGPSRAGDPALRMWESMLAIPLVIAAALGLIEIAERHVKFTVAAVAGLLTLIATARFAEQSIGLYGSEAGQSISGIVLHPLLAAVLVIAGLALMQGAQSSEPRRRRLLVLLLAAVVLSNCWWGISAIGRSTAGDRDIDDLRAALASRLPRVGRFTFVAPQLGTTTSSSQPPPRLVYGLSCLWPSAPCRFAASWEEATLRKESDMPADDTGATVFVAWMPRGTIRGAVPDPSLKSAGPPLLFQGLEVAVYSHDPLRAAGVD